VVFVDSRYLIGRDGKTAALQALAISCPAVQFVGVSIMGQLFGDKSAIPIAVAALAANLFQVPATLILVSTFRGGRIRSPLIGGAIIHTLRQPVVWAPLVALGIVALNLNSSLPIVVKSSLDLLGQATGGVAMFGSGIVLFSQDTRACLQSERSDRDIDGVNHGRETDVGFFIAGGDAPERLYPATEILDQMASFVFLPV